MVTLEEIRGKYRQQILDIAAKYGIYSLVVFGSVARGEQTEDSDIDFGYFSRDHDKVKGFAYFNINDELEELLEAKVDLVNIPYVRNLYRRGYMYKDMQYL